MGITSENRIIIALEIVLLLSGFPAVVHMLTRPGTGFMDLVYSFLILVVAGTASFVYFLRKQQKNGLLPAVLTALALGLWLFCFFRYQGLVKWPIGSAASLSGYAWLLYYHFVLAVSVIAPVLLLLQIAGQKITIIFGFWKSDKIKRVVSVFLFLFTLSTLFWAAFQIIRLPLNASGWFWGIVVVCLSKALITSATEEFCYRGIIQTIAVERYGVTGGIFFQALIYTAFHMHLGAAVNSGSLFLPAVMVLGVLFGVVSRMTSGIGWSVLNHMAINIGIEWWNISAV